MYVRPAGSYVMDRLELRRITFYPCASAADIVVLVGTFRIPAGLRVAEAAISSQQARILCHFYLFVYLFYLAPIRWFIIYLFHVFPVLL